MNHSLSVLIPVFNCSCHDLVTALHEQLCKEAIQWEIIVADDGSDDEQMKAAEETGSAFTDYVNALRIQEAGRLLADPTLKVYEVAERVGFTDYHYFLKIFRKVTGRSPTDLRN